MQTFLKIIKNYKLVGKIFFVSIFLWIAAESIYATFPQIIKHLMQVIENHQDANLLFIWTSIWLWLVVIASIIWYFNEVIDAKIWWEIYKTKNQIYKQKLFEKSYRQIIDEWTWKLITKFTRWLEAEANIFVSLRDFLVDTVVRLTLVFWVFAYFFPPFLLVLMLFLAIMIVVNIFIKNKMKDLVRAENEIFKQNNRLTIKAIMEFLLIKIFNKEQHEIQLSEKIVKDLPTLRAKIAKYQILFYVLLFFFIKSLEIGIYGFLGYLVWKWEYSIAFLIMVAGYLWMMWHPIERWIRIMNRILRQLETYKELQEFLEKPNPIKDWDKIYQYKKWEIQFKNVYFSYWNKPLFENLNLTFLPWKKNALVWHSWGGKSTIIKLILRFYDYEKWNILIDNQELKELKISSFYKYIGYLPQEPWVFDGTIRENLEYAFNKNLSAEEKEKIIWEALEKAQIADMVRQLDKQLDTEIWEKWIKLSWGEKQRLAIARLFIKNPKIIILDEPTSALDSISEYKITKALDELTKWKTSIIIAHRLQTVMHADQIIVLENWQIEATWTHNKLLNKSKVYKTLVDLQNGKIVE